MAAPQRDDGWVFDDADVLNSTQADGDHHEMSGYVQDNFEFLDRMDCNMDHVDCSVSYQVGQHEHLFCVVYKWYSFVKSVLLNKTCKF